MAATTLSTPRFTPLVGTLGYVWDRTNDRVLIIRRNARPDDDHFGKVNGLGGKVEPDESVVASLRRELREEAAIELDEFGLRGTINLDQLRTETGAVVGVSSSSSRPWTGEPPVANDEGQLEWIPRPRLLAACEGADPDLSLWAGDRHFVPLVFDDDTRAFHGTMPYDGDEPLAWSYERL